MSQANCSESNENERNGRLAGAGAGVVAGAQLGTVILPIPIVGTFTGALVGGLLGSRIGKKVGSALSDKFGTESASRSKTDMGMELQRLAGLHAQGVLSDEEFRAAKAKILGL